MAPHRLGGRAGIRSARMAGLAPPCCWLEERADPPAVGGVEPRHSLLTETPVRPSNRCSMAAPSLANGSRRGATPVPWRSPRLCSGTNEDLVERHAPRPGDGE